MLIVQVTEGQLQVFFTVGLIKIKTRLRLLLIYQVTHSVLGCVLSTWLPFADSGTKGFGSSVVTGINAIQLPTRSHHSTRQSWTHHG